MTFSRNNLETIHIIPEQVEFALKDYATLPVYWDSKRCATKHGFKSGIKHAPITQWLKDDGYNLAISLPFSNLVCIDVDRHNKDGLIAYKNLIKELGDIDTYIELTPTGGGLHVFVSAERILGCVRNCDLADGVEFKRNGYIVCAPSYFKGNFYKVVKGVNPDGTYKFAKLNDKWLEFINNKGKVQAVKPNIISKKAGKTTLQCKSLDYNKMLASCRFLKYLKQYSEEIPEPVWYSGINMLARNTQTDEFIHWLSQDYPKYTYSETQNKIEQSRKVGIFRGCNYIAQNHYDICKGCPKAEEIMRRINNAK